MKGKEAKNNHPFAFFPWLLIIFVLAGCSMQELDNKLILASIGIDKTNDNKIKLTMGLIDTRPTEQQEAKGVHIYSCVGETIYDAARNAITKLGKQPIWPYIKIIVFGPSISKDDIFPYLDFFNRNNEVQPDPYIVFSEEEAEKYVHLKVDFSAIPAVIMEQQLDQQNLVSYVPTVKLHQLTEMMLTQDKIGYCPIIRSKKEGSKEIPKILHTAVIKDAKWIGKLNKQESRGLLWVKNEVKGGILVIPSLEEKGKISLEILDKTKASIKPKVSDGKIRRIDVKIASTVNIGEMMSHTAFTKKNLATINKLAEKQIKIEIQSAIKQAKEMEVDIFGFGEVIHQKYPTVWK